MKKIMLHLTKLVSDATLAINLTSDINILNSIRIKYLGKKGHLNNYTIILRKLLPEERPKIGAVINKAKNQIQQAIDARKLVLKNDLLKSKLFSETIDVSLPGRRINNGGLHPVTRTIYRIESLFSKIGFSIVTGPEIEDDYHNFEALNIPKYHPSRTNKDTFWLDSKRLLRTQTSSIQIRIMQTQRPPIRIISSGRVYRKDYNQTHTPMFHQIEGLIVDKNINFANLKDILYNFLFKFFEKEEIQIRFRPSYFPFTEPSVEIDILKENNKWLEVLGCGLIHPKVLHNVNIDSEIYSGFAFGIGIERLTMLRYNITDLRMFFENDLRFLKQFR